MSDREFIAWLLVALMAPCMVPYLLWRARALRYGKALEVVKLYLDSGHHPNQIVSSAAFIVTHALERR